MKIFALALALTSAAAATNCTNVSTDIAVSRRLSAMPIPMCPPGDPNGCNIMGK